MNRNNEQPRVPVVEFQTNSGSDSSDVEWEYVPLGRGNIARTKGHSAHPARREVSPPDSISVDSLIEKVNNAIELLDRVLISENCFERYGDFLSDVTSIVGLGIGSIENTQNALFQFAFLVILHRKYSKTRTKNTVFYDPIVTPSETQAIRSFAIDVPSIDPNNEQDDQTLRISGKRLFFMPHCDRKLYEAVLHANQANLSDCVFVTNLFSYYGQFYPHTWERICSSVRESLFFVWEGDYEKYMQNSSTKDKFKPKLALKSETIPYAAFSDLAFVSVPSDEQVIQIINSTDWNKDSHNS